MPNYCPNWKDDCPTLGIDCHECDPEAYSCPATREAVTVVGECLWCDGPAEAHASEAFDA